MLTTYKRKILFWSSVAIFIAMMPIVVLYALGYRFDDSWVLRKTGGIYVNADVSGSEIFIDGEFEARTNLLTKGVFIDNLTPGTYEITVLRENYLPWRKNLIVSSQLVTEAKALLVPSQTAARIITQGNFSDIHASTIDPIIILSEEKIVRWYSTEREGFLTDTGALLSYRDDFNVVRWLDDGVILSLDKNPYRVRFNINGGTASVIPLGSESPIKSVEESREIFTRKDTEGTIEVRYSSEDKILKALWTGNGIFPYYFHEPEEIILQNKLIKNFELYPGRKDAVVAAFDNGIWVTEIDGRDQRITQPIYKGRDPNFAFIPGGKEIFILDNGILIEASLRAE